MSKSKESTADKISSGKQKVKLERRDTTRFVPLSLVKEVKDDVAPDGSSKSRNGTKMRDGVFQGDNRREMFKRYLRANMVTINAPISILPYLVLDDRIACKYNSKSRKGYITQPGGYYRGYDAIDGVMYLSSFDYPAENQLISLISNVKYIAWSLELIDKLYITIEMEARIIEEMATAPRDAIPRKIEPLQRAGTSPDLTRLMDPSQHPRKTRSIEKT